MEQENKDLKAVELPENAFRELKEGEQYEPVMRGEVCPEVNGWSVIWGILMAVLFSAAAAYLGLKVGQVFEAAIPIAIIAVGASTAARRKNALGENVKHRGLFGCSRGRSYLHFARYLHSSGQVSRDDSLLLQHLYGLSLGRNPRHSVPYSVPKILCQRYAW